MSVNQDKEVRIAYIVQKCKTFETKTEALKSFLDSPNADPVNANLRSKILESLFVGCSKYIDELTSLQSDHPLLLSFIELETNFYTVAAAVTKLQNVESPLSSTLNTTNFTLTERHNLPKLPEIKLPTFDGKREDWLSYKNRFVALVDSRTDLSNYVKHTQLLSSLTGSAKNKIVEFEPSEEDYPKAWQALIDSYDHKRIVAVEHLDALIDLPVLASATADNLSTLLDKARQHVHMLERLDARPGDELVVRIMERCLPPATRNKWQDKLELDSLPKLNDLFKFLQANIFKLQALESSTAASRNNSQTKKRAGDKLEKGQNKIAKVEARSLVTTTSNVSKIVCPKCNENHHLFKCPVFEKLQVSKRWDFARANRMCFNCLYVHPLPCKSEKRCKKCQQNHHTLLHSDKKPQTVTAETSKA